LHIENIWVLCKYEEIIHFHRVLCEDTNDTHICNQWYTSFSFEQKYDFVIDSKKEIDMNIYTSCIAIPMDMINYYKYLVTNFNWEYRNQGG
jgi:hypothetical protein